MYRYVCTPKFSISNTVIHCNITVNTFARSCKNENLSIIVATDIAARGIDVADLTFVVHFQLFN